MRGARPPSFERTASLLTTVGVVSHDLGDIVAARSYLREALAIESEAHDVIELARAIEAFACLCEEDQTRAARLLGFAERLREENAERRPVGVPPPSRIERYEAAVRSALGDDAFGRLWNEGRSMSVAEAVRYALSA